MKLTDWIAIKLMNHKVTYNSLPFFFLPSDLIRMGPPPFPVSTFELQNNKTNKELYRLPR